MKDTFIEVFFFTDEVLPLGLLQALEIIAKRQTEVASSKVCGFPFLQPVSAGSCQSKERLEVVFYMVTGEGIRRSKESMAPSEALPMECS